MAPNQMFLVLLLHLLATLTANARVPAIIVFGDSSVDAGNNNNIPTILKSNFEPYGRDFFGRKPTGRFSNGRIPTDFISEAFGIKQTIPAYLDPTYSIRDFATGVCFASAGSGYDNSTSDFLSVIPLWKEVEYFKEYKEKLVAEVGNKETHNIISNALYLVSIGTNDFLENYYMLPGRSSQFDIEGYQRFLIGSARHFIEQLHELGARKISIGGLMPMGCLPLERFGNMGPGSDCVEHYNDVAMKFNQKLQGLVYRLNRKLPGVQLVYSDVYHIFYEMIRHPKDFGFDNSRLACCGTGLFEMSFLCDKDNPFTCTDADKYVFWDSFHPSERANNIVADYVIKNVLYKFM